GHEGRRNQEWLDAHVDQTGDGAGGVVGVQGGQHQVTRERGLDGDLRRLEIAHFADHDDVRILPEERAQRLAEGHPLRVVDGNLDDAFDVVFDGVLRREQLDVDAV